MIACGVLLAIRVETVRLATPPITVLVPSTVLPSLKTTDPVGSAMAGKTEPTVAVKVTALPKIEGLGDELSAVEVVARGLSGWSRCC